MTSFPLPVALRTAALAAVLCALPVVAPAADLPVSYTVDAKALKAAVTGTNLTFELFSDNACTTLVHSAVVTIDDVSIREKIGQFKPSGGASAPKVVELHETLAGVDTFGNLFLEVTGTGITAVAGACQAQAASVAGDAVVADGSGTVMGPSLDGGSFLTPVGPDLVRLPVTQSGYYYSTYIYFAGASCTGQAYAFTQSPGLFKFGFPVDATSFYVGPTTGLANHPWGSIEQIDSNSISGQGDCDSYFGPGNSTFDPPAGCCCNACSGGPGLLVPITMTPLPSFTPPFSLQLP